MFRITFIAFLFVIPCSFGQLIQSRIAKETTLDQTFNHALMGEANKRLLSFSEKKESINIDIYDTDSLNLLYHEQLQLLGSDGSNLEVQGVFNIKNQFRLVATGRMAAAKRFGVFVYTILENGKLSETFEQTFFDFDSESVKIRTQVQTNPQHSLLFIHLAFENQDIIHRTLVYDENLLNVFKLEHTPIPAPAKNHNYKVSYFPGETHVYELNEEILYNKEVKRYQTVIELKKYDLKSAKEVAKQSIALTNGFMLSDVLVKEMGDEVQLIASNLASYGKTISGIRGIYSARFNSDLSLKFAKGTPFSASTKAKSLKGYENAEELDVPLLYVLVDHITDSKGNDYLLYERGSKTTTNGLTEYYFGSIIAVKLNSEGIVEWETFIAKSQFFQEKGIPIMFVVPGLMFSTPFSIRFTPDSRQYLSFKPLLKNDEVYLICNDNPKNEGKSAGQGRENMINIDQSVPFAIRLSPEGKVDYQILKNLKVGEENQRIIYSVIRGTTLFTLRDSGKKEVLQRIEFE